MTGSAGRRVLLKRAVLVAAGGALGASARAWLEAAAPVPAGGIPWTTFVINVVGSCVLGALLEALVISGADEGWRRRVRLGVGTGVLGGFTTYSTFVAEADALLGSGHTLLGAAYALASVMLGVAAAVVGIRTARHALEAA